MATIIDLVPRLMCPLVSLPGHLRECDPSTNIRERPQRQQCKSTPLCVASRGERLLERASQQRRTPQEDRMGSWKRYRTLSVTATSLAVLAIASMDAAQANRTAVKLFEDRPVTLSPSAPVTFDEVRLQLGCSGRANAVIASTPDGRGGFVVDNVLTVNGVNVCTGQLGHGEPSCFQGFFGAVGDPPLAAYGAVAPVDIRGWLPFGKKEVVTFQLRDGGVLFANSDVWLVTNCVVHNKVELCHKPGTPAEHTIDVAQSSVTAHLGHGDYIGRCSST
jgi:hypothetical protein